MDTKHKTSGWPAMEKQGVFLHSTAFPLNLNALGAVIEQLCDDSYPPWQLINVSFLLLDTKNRY